MSVFPACWTHVLLPNTSHQQNHTLGLYFAANWQPSACSSGSKGNPAAYE
jgi:hypothetical protein